MVDGRATHRVRRTISSGLWTTARRYELASGTQLRLIEVVHYLEDIFAFKLPSPQMDRWACAPMTGGAIMLLWPNCSGSTATFRS
jgi:hypothetical protein